MSDQSPDIFLLVKLNAVPAVNKIVEFIPEPIRVDMTILDQIGSPEKKSVSFRDRS